MQQEHSFGQIFRKATPREDDEKQGCGGDHGAYSSDGAPGAAREGCCNSAGGEAARDAGAAFARAAAAPRLGGRSGRSARRRARTSADFAGYLSGR